MSQRNLIQKFVKDVLGCICPDEIFKDIQKQWRLIQPEEIKVFEIRIGGRLLIYFWDINDSSAQDGFLSVIQAGKDIRDKDGFNRFRLVVTGNLNQNIKSDLETRFQNSFPGAERIHLHFITKPQIPQNLFSIDTSSLGYHP